jgi:hypothetical protein
MTIGSTSGKEPDHIEDGDLKTLDEMRGAMRDLAKAHLSVGEKASVNGVMVELDVMKQRFALQGEQINRLIGMYATLRGEFDQFQRQRVIELQSWLATGGSTTPEDSDGSDD